MTLDGVVARSFSRPPRPNVAVRLICFPYAGGGSAIYRDWQAALAPEIDVCPLELPGRGMRIREPCSLDLRALARSTAVELAPHLEVPFAFVGYSMGALLAFETAVALRGMGHPVPLHLFVAARPAPHWVSAAGPLRADLDDRALWEALRARYGRGLDPALLRDEATIAFLTRVIRADLTMLAHYRVEAVAPLSCPITAFCGQQDGSVAPEGVTAWARHTTGSFRLHTFAGRAHFFLDEERSSLCEIIERSLSDARAAGRRSWSDR